MGMVFCFRDFQFFGSWSLFMIRVAWFVCYWKVLMVVFLFFASDSNIWRLFREGNMEFSHLPFTYNFFIFMESKLCFIFIEC